MRELHSDYSPHFDSVDEAEWYDVMREFDDANIYQTWAYDAIRCGVRNISHFVLRRNGCVVAAAQARILELPVIRQGIAYIRWAPMWKLRGGNGGSETFQQAIRALRNEYVLKRGLILRLRPALFKNNSDDVVSILKEEGYLGLDDGDSERTLLMDIRRPLEEVRKGHHQKWRNCLNRAEKNELEVIEGHEDNLFDIFIEIYRGMLKRKRFVEPNDINEFRLIQRDLPEEFKMKIILCCSQGKPSAGSICSAIGSTGIYLFGATNEIGLGNKGSYLSQWRIIEWLKKIECSTYDLNGINPQTNPGTYQFKAGLCGKNGQDVQFLGQFDAYPNFISQVLLRWGDKFRGTYRRSRGVVNRLLRHRDRAQPD